MMELYGITKEAIQETRDWEEGRITIDIEKKTFDFDVLHKYTIEEFKEYCEDEKVKEINRTFNNIQFEDVFELKAFIDKANYNDEYYFNNNGEYISLIQ